MHALIIQDQFLIATLIEDELRELGYSSSDIVDREKLRSLPLSGVALNDQLRWENEARVPVHQTFDAPRLGRAHVADQPP